MELKVVFLIVCLCALAVASTEAGIHKCCIKTKEDIPVRMLQRVQGWSVQHSSGACDITALMLRVKGMRKPVCAHPKVKKALMVLMRRMKQKKQKDAY
ncbi:C-C motif chemokine 27a [Pseudoliparis swirei]|uniref:C-C motif chemokine 27a n=1 Tax=Pseudoliparis swirei TaxID=2059687 RepID=UPI0024BF00A4|nr:C-C motif chemokine 27a [Pseudoliparis swirei]